MNPYKKTHDLVVAYFFWLFLGIFGTHRFYLGKALSGLIWLFTFGILGLGWLLDLFLIPRMHKNASLKFSTGKYNYSIAWLLLTFAGVFGFHRFYLNKVATGALYLFTFGLCGLGVLYDICTLNDEINMLNLKD